MDLFAAERLPCEPWDSGGKHVDTDLVFTSYSVRRTGGSLLKERCRLKLKVERNLDRQVQPVISTIITVSTCPSSGFCFKLKSVGVLSVNLCFLCLRDNVSWGGGVGS